MPTSQSTRPRRLLDQVAAFRYVTVENAPIYRALVQVFYEARQRYVIELRPAEVLARLEESDYHAELGGDGALDRHLEQLAVWGNLSHRHDTAAVSRIEDFYRRSFVYNLSAVGEAAHRAVLEVEATVGRSGSLQATMLKKIRDTLLALAAGDEPRALMGMLHDLDAAFETLTEEASRFIGDLDKAKNRGSHDEESFRAYKQAVFAYVSRFVDKLRRLASEISEAILAVRTAGLDELLQCAARSGDLPPAPDGADPAAAWIGEEEARFEGLAGWFVGEGAHQPTVERLANAAVGAVVDLTRTLARLNEQRSRPADRAADMRRLACWIMECERDADAHEIWHGAFGIYPPRHFHLAEDDPDASSPTTSWWDARPVRVPIRLRTKGSVSRAGRAPAVADHSSTRQWLVQLRRREREQVDLALRRFLGRGPMRLSELGAVNDNELEVLLDLLDESLSRPPDEQGARRGRTADGRLIVSVLPPEEPFEEALIHTRGGTLRCTDYRLEVRGAGGSSKATADPGTAFDEAPVQARTAGLEEAV